MTARTPAASPPSSRERARFTRWHPAGLMEWAKFGTGNARYNLARSGIPAVPDLSQIPGGPYVPALTGVNYAGHEGLKAAVAAMYGAQPENVLLAQGASQCNFLIAGAALSGGGVAIVESPCYEPLLRSVEVWADRVIRLPRPRNDRYQPDPDQFERLLAADTRLVVLTNLHNPSHLALDPARLDAILAAAHAVGASVMLDEVYLRMLQPDSHLHGFGRGAVSVNSLGKAWGLDCLRIGWAVGPVDLVHRAYRLNNLLGVNQPYMTEDMACQILSSPAAVDWLTSRMRRALDGRALFDRFRESLPGLECVLPDAGISACLELPHATNDTVFVEHLIAAYSTAVFPGHFYGMPGTVRVSFGGDPDDTTEGLNRLATAISEL